MYEYLNLERVEHKIESILRQYQVMDEGQLKLLFSSEEKAVVRAVKRLEKKKQIYRHPHTGLLSPNESMYSLKDDGTIKCLWVLVDMINRGRVGLHFMACREEYPIRIFFVKGDELYSLLYVGMNEVKLANSIMNRKAQPTDQTIIVAESREVIQSIQIPETIGYCVVNGGGEIEYYRRT